MKRFALILLIITGCVSVGLASQTASAAPYGIKDIPNVQIANRYNFTSNPDGILSAEAVAKIDSVCYDLRHRGMAQAVVVAVREIDSDDVFDFAYQLFSEWGVGNKSDNGIGILLVESVHEIRFVTGYGLEGVLPDAICKRIQTQYMLPHFRKDDYSGGMVAGIEAVRQVLDGSELDNGGNDDFVSTKDDDMSVIFLFGGFIILYLIIILLINRASRRCPKCHKIALKLDSTQLISRENGVSVYEDTYICSKCGATVKRRRRTDNNNNNGSGGHRSGGGGTIIGGMGGFGGRGFGGGSMGGGFGGGRFGGGGAGSRW